MGRTVPSGSNISSNSSAWRFIKARFNIDPPGPRCPPKKESPLSLTLYQIARQFYLRKTILGLLQVSCPVCRRDTGRYQRSIGSLGHSGLCKSPPEEQHEEVLAILPDRLVGGQICNGNSPDDGTGLLL